MNRFLLYLIMLPGRLWERLGADTEQLRALLDVKLKLDDRRPAGFGRQRNTKNAKHRFAIFFGMLVSFATGVIYIFPLIIIEDPLSGLWLFYTMFLFLLSLTLISDFSTILIDTRDKYIVLPQPVSDRTFLLSRILHIFIYLFRMVLPMSLPGWVTISALYDWKAALLFPIPLLLLVFTALFVVMGVYLLLLRLSSPGKFKEWLSYFQIGFSIIVFGAYYLVPRAMDVSALKYYDVSVHTWILFTPSFWLAAIYSWIIPFKTAILLPMFAVPAICLPLVLIWLTVRYLAPQFGSRIVHLDAVEAEAGSLGRKRSKGKTSTVRIAESLATWLNRRPEAQAGFLMAWIQTGRSRSFKMKVYPMFAYVPIYFVYLMMQSRRPLHEVWEQLPHTGKHIILLYMSCIVMLQALAHVTISDQYKASWIYWASPIHSPGAIMAGSFKVIWIKFFFPFFTLISMFILALWGLAAGADLLLALVNVTLFAVFIARFIYRRFPFSQLEQTTKNGSKFLKSMLGMLIPSTLGIAHYLASDMLWLKLIFLALSSILLWLVWDSYANTNWESISPSE